MGLIKKAKKVISKYEDEGRHDIAKEILYLMISYQQNMRLKKEYLRLAKRVSRLRRKQPSDIELASEHINMSNLMAGE